MYKLFFAASEKPVLARAIESDMAGKLALRTLLRYFAKLDATVRVTISADAYDRVKDIKNFNSLLRLFGLP